MRDLLHTIAFGLVLTGIAHIIWRLKMVDKTLDDVAAEAAQSREAVERLSGKLTDLIAVLKANRDDPAKLQAIIDDLDATEAAANTASDAADEALAGEQEDDGEEGEEA